MHQSNIDWAINQKLKAKIKLVLIMIAVAADKDGLAKIPDIVTLAIDCCQYVHKTREHVVYLMTAGYVDCSVVGSYSLILERV